MPTRVWLMRHAETARPDVFHGFESNIDLSERGYRQAAAAAPVIASYRPDAVVASNMLRARRTAEPIAAACGLALRIEPELHERKVGNLAGRPARADTGIWADTLRRWLDGEASYAPEGAESFADMRERLLPVWDRVVAEHRGRSIAVICHGIVCRVLLLSLLEGYTVRDWAKIGPTENLSISELEGDGRRWRAMRVAQVPAAVEAIR